MTDSGSLKSIALTELHQSLGAKMVPFAGYLMPVRYSGDVEEHLCVRNNVGVFDVSHMGEFFVSGEGALELVQFVTSNDVSALTPGKIQYSCLPNENGGIIDDLLVYMIAENHYMLVVNAGNIDKDFAWISKQNSFGAKLVNHSDYYSLFAVQGPKAAQALQSLTDVNLSEMAYYTFSQGTFAGAADVIISATGYTGAGGFEIYVKNENALKVWNAIFEAGKAFDIKPIGLGARDTLRLEMGFCLYGNDIDDTTSPLEAGLGWITKLKKADFSGKAAIEAVKAAGLSKKLTGIKMVERAIPRQGYDVYSSNDKLIGKVTSGTISPVLNYGIAMAYLDTAHQTKGEQVFVEIRGKKVAAEVCGLPFLQKP